MPDIVSVVLSALGCMILEMLIEEVFAAVQSIMRTNRQTTCTRIQQRGVTSINLYQEFNFPENATSVELHQTYHLRDTEIQLHQILHFWSVRQEH